MATGSFIGVTPGAGAKLSTGPLYTENANVVQDQKIIEGEAYLSTYTVSQTGGAVMAGANAHTLQIMAGSSLIVRLRRLTVWQLGLAGAITMQTFSIVRLTSAGTGGTALTPLALEQSDPGSGATAMRGPTTPGTVNGTLYSATAPVLAALWTVPSPPMIDWNFEGMDNTKVPMIAAGVANGLALMTLTAIATATIIYTATFVESAF